MKAHELDKTFKAGVGNADSYGTVTIRVVVLPPPPPKKEGEVAAVVIDPDEPGIEAPGGPLDSYLERPRGEGYVVFLVHGQRQDVVDESFVQHELGFKYLRNRAMIIIDVDGLAPEAIGELVQGSRQGFYKGAVYYAVFDRVVAVLKKDPDLMRLEDDAERQIAELRTGNEAVRRKLDELIQGHYTAGAHTLPGDLAKGAQAGMGGPSTVDMKSREVVIHAIPDVGKPAALPVLTVEPAAEVIRLHPNEERKITVRAMPVEEWQNVETRSFTIDPSIPELQLETEDLQDGVVLRLLFKERQGAQDDDYPVNATLTIFTAFHGQPEPRLIERKLIIRRKTAPPPPPPPPVLRPDPTYLQVSSRQPVKLVAGGPSTHVRLRWDGEDDLVSGWPPKWNFEARCLSLETYPPPIFAKPRAGNIELLLDTPHGLLPDQHLEFEVQAIGPLGATLSAVFKGQVVEPPPEPEPRKKQQTAPAPVSQRRPPYELKEVTQQDWQSPTCWKGTQWTQEDAGCFDEPTASTPLTLIINRDAQVLKAARELMLARLLDEKTIADRVERYISHVYFHLYKMYEYVGEVKRLHQTDESLHIPADNELRAEINRVGATLATLMDR